PKVALVGEGTKRSPLYLDRALAARCRQVVLVEGPFDAGIAQAYGDPRVIACVAAMLSDLQVKTLKRCGIESVIITLDPDCAGEAGILSCLKSLDAAGITGYVAPKLPDGMDPDEFIVAHGLEAWKEHVGAAIHGYRYQAEVILARHRNGGHW